MSTITLFKKKEKKKKYSNTQLLYINLKINIRSFLHIHCIFGNQPLSIKRFRDSVITLECIYFKNTWNKFLKLFNAMQNCTDAEI